MVDFLTILGFGSDNRSNYTTQLDEINNKSNATTIMNINNSEIDDTTIIATNSQPSDRSNYNFEDPSTTNGFNNEFNSNNLSQFDLNNNNNNITRQTFNSNGNRTITPNINDEDDFNFNLFGTVIYPFRWITLPTLYSFLGPISSLAMIIGCVLPYVPQYITIYKNRNCQGFSTFVCLTLLIANILRVAFWFGHPFETPLLIQSGLMILAQIFLLELCVRVKKQNSTSIPKNRTFLTSSPRYFWRWTNLVSYIEFLILFSLILGISMYYLVHCETFVEVIGYCALVTESMLGLPQVIKNYKNKSVEGMSLSMVLMWLAGDTFKTCYFIANNVPYQFWLCGLLQITIDIIILMQVCIFRQNAPIKLSTRSKEESSPKEMMAL